MEIIIDFDGTVVTHDFPYVGKSIGAETVLRKLIDAGHNLILFTMRSNIKNPKSSDKQIILQGGNYLNDAVNWFKERGIPLYGVQTNPTQHMWTHSPKAYGHLIIDDTAIGVPLISNPEISSRPFVDWVAIEKILLNSGVI